MTKLFKSSAIALCAAAAIGASAPATAQYSGDVIRVGFLTDISGV